MRGQLINESIPKSTLWIGSAFWLVLVGLVGWNLLETIAGGRHDAAMDRAYNDLDKKVDDHETRLRSMEWARRSNE